MKKENNICGIYTYVENEQIYYEIGMIYNQEFDYKGKEIEELFSKIFTYFKGGIFYCSELKMIGPYILLFFFRNNFVFSKNPKNNGEFNAIINDIQEWYCLKVIFDDYVYQFWDLEKIIPYEYSNIISNFGFNIEELLRKYDTNNKNLIIMKECLKMLLDSGIKEMTMGMSALLDFKRIVKKQFETLFPKLTFEEDKFIRKSYKGGFNFLNPSYKEIEIHEGISIDINSMYPYIAKEKPLPCGRGIYFKGKYKHDECFPLYIQHIICTLLIKDDGIPTVILKDTLEYKPGEYIKDTSGNKIELWVTNLDLELLIDNYIIDKGMIKYIDGYKYSQCIGIFSEYVEKWYNKKQRYRKEGKIGKAEIAKLMLNSLIGKFGKKPIIGKSTPIYDINNDELDFLPPEWEASETLYCPIASFINAWGRYILINDFKKLGELAIYSDTDCIKIIGNPDFKKMGIEIDPEKLGAYKIEYRFKKAKFIREKCYIELKENGEIKVTCSGMNEFCKKQVTFENFKVGAIYTENVKLIRTKKGVTYEKSNYMICE